jgi:hypothetical protein
MLLKSSPARQAAGLLVLLLALPAGAAADDAVPASARSGAESDLSMVIVAPARFESALLPLVEHRRADLPTEFAALERVLQEQQGVDDPERLKRFLYARWQQQRLRYVLLVGDADVLPVRYMVLDRITAPAHDIAFYPSDLYYADVAGQDGTFDDWNACRDGYHAGYFGEVRGEKNKDGPINFDRIHYRPELAVGRWPVDSADEIQRLIAKTIAFEKRLSNPQDRPPRAGLLAVGGWVDSRPCLDRVATALPDTWQIEKRYYADARRPAATPPSTEEFLELLNTGVDLLCHAGHGTDTSWADCLAWKDFAKVDNAAQLPVIISAGCSTARFATLPPYEPYEDVDGVQHRGTNAGQVFGQPPPPPAAYQRERNNPPGLGERLLRAGPTGAVAYIGCNTGSQPCGLTLLEGFARTWGNAAEPRLGDCWNGAIDFYVDRERLADLQPTSSWYPPSIFFQGMKFMVFGDPALRLPR